VTRALLSALALAAAATTLRAAETNVRAEVDAERLGVEDQVQLTLTVSGDAAPSADVALPALRNLRVAGGPSVSTQFSIVNGAISQQRVFAWVLEPAAVGKAEIGAFTVQLPGGPTRTEPIALEVVPGSIRPAPARRADPFDPFGGEDPFEAFFGRRGGNRNRPAPKVLVKAVPGRGRLHVGEPLLLTYYVYTQASITDLRFAEAPSFPGFWSEDLPQPKGGPRGEPAALEGERFERFAVLRKLLFPTRPGRLEIPAATFRIGVARQGLLDVGSLGVTRSSQVVAVDVDPIPEEPGFSGAVGRFRATAGVDKSSLALGEAATLRFRVEGSGNLKWIDKGPSLSLPGAKVYPPSTTSDLETGPEGISGSKTWEFAIVPETAGRLEVPPLEFAYFDPRAGRIARAATAALSLEVLGGAPAALAPSGSALPPAAARGGLPLRAELDLPAAGLRQPTARLVALALLAGVLLHVALIAGPGLAGRLRAVRGGPAPRGRTRAALAAIERVRRDRLGKEAAAAALEKALHDVFGALEDGSGPAAGERERAAREVLGEVQFLRYAPQLGDYSDKIRDVADRAAELVRRWA
jgi:hypothetical protein